MQRRGNWPHHRPGSRGHSGANSWSQFAKRMNQRRDSFHPHRRFYRARDRLSTVFTVALKAGAFAARRIRRPAGRIRPPADPSFVTNGGTIDRLMISTGAHYLAFAKSARMRARQGAFAMFSRRVPAIFIPACELSLKLPLASADDISRVPSACLLNGSS